MEVISRGRMSNQSHFLLEGHSRGECVQRNGERERFTRAETEQRKDNIQKLPIMLCQARRPAGQTLGPSAARASRASTTFTKYPLMSHSWRFVPFIFILASLPPSALPGPVLPSFPANSDAVLPRDKPSLRSLDTGFARHLRSFPLLQLPPRSRTSRSARTVCSSTRTERRPSATTVERCCGDSCGRG